MLEVRFVGIVTRSQRYHDRREPHTTSEIPSIEQLHCLLDAWMR
jgi:hypothetical protein